MAGIRLRQVALVATGLAPVADALRATFDLGEPYRDPGVGEFGLENTVFALGDTFVEVIAPVRAGTAAGRYLDRRGGDGGYMVILQCDDLQAARQRAAEADVRVVWHIDLPDIAGTHLHPKDVPGALVSLDWADPPGSWRWAGPSWTGAEPAPAPGPARRITGVTIESERADSVAARWGEVLAIDPDAVDGGWEVPLDGGRIRFVPPVDDRGEGIVGIDVQVADPLAPGPRHVGGVRWELHR